MSRGTDARYGRQGGRLEPWERRNTPTAVPTERHPLTGLTCTCPPKCTDIAWGDGGNCDPHCRPCQIMAGRQYSTGDLPGFGAKR